MKRASGLLAAGVLAPALLLPQTVQKPVQEQVHVTVVEVTLHAADRTGEPVRGLGPRDLRLFVDGRDVPIESLDWVSNEPKAATEPVPTPPAPALAATPAAAEAPVPTGRLIVFFFQWHIEAVKIEGHLRLSRQALEFLDTLQPDDEVAVVTFGSSLWLRQDFTRDRARVRAAIRNALVLDNAPASPGPPSLEAIVRDHASVTSIEKAFAALGDALRPLAGSKAILFLGWGVGEASFLGPGGSLGTMRYSADYERAIAALGRAQAPVFSLDVSGGHHSLEAGLERLSFETGGYYLPTWDFPRWAMKTAASAIKGHYVLVFRPPALPKHGFHEIRLDGPPGVKLLYRQGYED
ncbi:MAG TPA: VWA domain-containing protein [Thermoanaerobaculia bacterium]|nr:VWA domain-containing protein [Thermoanaerobaculia bacterium]